MDDADVAFTPADTEALARAVGLVRKGVVDEETAITWARALGQTTDRLVSWQVEALLEQLHRDAADADGSGATAGDVDGALDRIAAVTDDLELLVVYSWRRRLAEAIARLVDLADSSGLSTRTELTVGFADLVSYTRLSHRLEHRELVELVQRFEGLAADVVTAGGGRVVKNVGDEVLFTVADPAACALIGLSLSERMAVDDLVPDVRVGLAHGPVLRSLGDVYGPTVNLASRLTAIAQPGTVVTDPATAALLGDRAELLLVRQRRRQVRGFGQLEPLLIARSGPGIRLISLDDVASDLPVGLTPPPAPGT